MTVSNNRILIGVISGAVARGCALIFYLVPQLGRDGIEKFSLEPLFAVVAVMPTMFVGAVIGFLAGSRSRMWQGVLVGTLLSMAVFALWSNGPIVWWVLSIRFNAQLTIYFAIAGAFAGYLPFALLGERRPATSQKNEK